MLEHTTLSAGKGYAVTVFVPDEATYKRLLLAVEAINPSAFQPVPVPEGIAQAVKRDVLPRANFPPFVTPPAPDPVVNLPPNCDGCLDAIGYREWVSIETVEAMFPRDPEQDDDEGIEAEPARYPPGVACNISGECE